MSAKKITLVYGLRSRQLERVIELLRVVQHATVIDSYYLSKKYKNLTKSKVPIIVAREIEMALKRRNKIIVYVESLHRGFRTELLRLLNKLDIQKECLIVAVKYRDCYASIDDYKEWNTPHKFEGWDAVKLIYPNKKDKEFLGTIDDVINKYIGYNQSSLYHKHTLGEHMRIAKNTIDNNMECSIEAYYATAIHDIGKPFVRVTDGKKIRYANHQNVGAYDSLFVNLPNCDIIEVSTIINLHMEPYKWERGKNFKVNSVKYRELWGEQLYYNVMALHIADKAAH